MNKILNILLIAGISMFVITSCQDFLEQPSYGILAEEDIVGVQQVENLCISAYAGIANDEINRPRNLWGYGNVRADDAYKGGNDQNDGEPLHFLEISSPSIANETWFNDGFWYQNYVAISRINSALRALNNISDDEMPNKTIRIAEMRFLRGHIHFIQKLVFKMIPYITEDMSPEDITNTSNVLFTNDELWQKIADDFEFAYQNLPESQAEVGRPNKYAAAAYLAKSYLYKAYRQDEKHNVTEIDNADMQKVITFADEVINSPYRLENDFANNFLPGEYENGVESLFAVQFSQEDGTTFGRLNMGNALTTPTPGGDFNKPSQSLVNAFITKDGIPDFKDYNKSDYDEMTDKVDPRLFHTVAIPGNPYKYTDLVFENSDYFTISRNPSMYGTYSSLKENVDPLSIYYVQTGPWYANSKNWIVLRYSDVLLFKAEALIELGNHLEALTIINQVRNRAKASTGLIGFALDRINISEYQNGVNCNWDQSFAREALRYERRLEMAMEGSRFFDLVRWGVTDKVINAFYDKEKKDHTYYNNARFEKNKNEYSPIPVQQINFSKGIYEQNWGFQTN